MNAYTKISTIAAMGLAFVTSPLQAMENEKNLSHFLNTLNKTSTGLLQSSATALRLQDDNTKLCYIETVLDDIKIIVMRDLNLEELASLSYTSKSLRASVTSAAIFDGVIKPKCDFLINFFDKIAIYGEASGFRYRSLERESGESELTRKRSRKPNSAKYRNEKSVNDDAYIVKNLAIAGSLGSGDAYLLLAELDWAESCFTGKRFMRSKIYQRALESKIPGTDIPRFNPLSDEYNTALLGIAEHMTTNYPDSPNKIYRRHVELAVLALTAVTDSLLWDYGTLNGVSQRISSRVLSLLWNGNYAPYTSTFKRPITEKSQDMELIVQLAQHARSLGLNVKDRLRRNEEGLISFLSTLNKASTSSLQNYTRAIDENAEPCYIETVPDDIKITILRHLDLEELATLSYTAKSLRALLTSAAIHARVIKPAIDFYIDSFDGFCYRSIENKDSLNKVSRKDSPKPNSAKDLGNTYYIVKNLAAAGSLGSGDAYLLLAELDWQEPWFTGKHFMRSKIYQRALESKIPGTDTPRFDPLSDEYNAALLGLAEHMVTNYPGSPNKIYRRHVELAVSALTAVTNRLFWENGKIIFDRGTSLVSTKLLWMLWTGDYAPYLSKRANDRKIQDFESMFSLVQHGLVLGLDEEDELYKNQTIGIPISSLKIAAQKELFINKHLRLMFG